MCVLIGFQYFERLSDPEIKKKKKKVKKLVNIFNVNAIKMINVFSLVSGLSISSHEFFKFSIDINHSLQLDTATFHLFPLHRLSFSFITIDKVSLNNNSTKISINRN